MSKRQKTDSNKIKATVYHCEICNTTQTKINQLYTLTNECKHHLCVNCLADTITKHYLVKNQWPAKCLWCKDEQHNTIDLPLIEPVLQICVELGYIQHKHADKFISKQVLTALPDELQTQCPKCDTYAIVSKENCKQVTCSSCNIKYCHQCKSVWHKSKSCVEYQQSVNKGTDTESSTLLKTTSKKCPGCFIPTTVWKDHGCHQISCTQCYCCWCYECGTMYEPPTKDKTQWKYYSDENWKCDCECFDSDIFECCCEICPDCKPGEPCDMCDDGCQACIACSDDCNSD